MNVVKYWWSIIIALWKANGGSAWDPCPTLAHHLLHVCGGAAVVLFGMGVFGLQWWNAALLSTCIFLGVELSTAFRKHNWKDSWFDFWQYNMHWLVYFAMRDYWWLVGAGFAIWLTGYFYMLITFRGEEK